MPKKTEKQVKEVVTNDSDNEKDADADVDVDVEVSDEEKEVKKVSKPKVKSQDTQDTNDEKELNKVSVDDFNVSKYKLDPVDDKFSSASQYMSFPRYDYGSKKSGKVNNFDRMLVVTDEITMTKGGIPSVGGDYRPTENHCMYFWLPLLKEDANAQKLLNDVLNPLDNLCNKKINVEKNSSNFVTLLSKDKKPLRMKGLKYLSTVKLSKLATSAVEADDHEDNDHIDENESGSNQNNGRYQRVRVKLATVFEKDVPKDQIKKLKMNVYTYGKDGNPRLENVTTMEELRKLFTWKCTARYVLDVSKFWIMKNENEDGFKTCGHGIKCIQMLITKRGEMSKGTSALNASIFGINPNKQKQLVDEDEEDQEDQEDQEVKKPTQKVNDKKKTKKVESDNEEENNADADADVNAGADADVNADADADADADVNADADNDVEVEESKSKGKKETKPVESDHETDEVEEEKQVVVKGKVKSTKSKGKN